MNPSQPESFNHRTETLSTGRTYHFVDQLPDAYDPKRNPTLLCVHGFPDLWYGWRYQIGPWVRRGCRVIAPDMLGYGGTSKPVEAEQYSTKRLCADLAALLDSVGVRKAVLIGHDWGSHTVGRFALWYPDRLLALIMLSIPYTPPSREYMPVEEVARRAPNLGYQVYFNAPNSNLEILAHLKKFLPLTFSPPDSKHDYFTEGSLQKLLLKTREIKTESFLSDLELNYYYSELQKGMFGPLNYYRTAKFRHDEELAAGLPATLRPDLPFLFMWGTKDATATPFSISKSRKFIPKYQDVAFEGRGHWLMVEAKDEVTQTVINWLESLTSKPKL
ncbi:Bifunctional epoxide hydrolase 2 [Psilocybe cubensis]|uniref:Bifunctional epoxide hydrolase 2 n=2 Tax=Psilocybe cubensis TaxID=181762 RepID=A0ACB8H3C9_PSICU|nr:Bifunctional epoxide hydrolase 2 [Psilocybe cubensis]KAH9482500.1 Bifunctional epoxide hydrolase 2 [Psilocybe cubensis]